MFGLDWIQYLSSYYLGRCLSQINEYRPWHGGSDQFIICPTSLHSTASQASQTRDAQKSDTNMLEKKKNTINNNLSYSDIKAFL